MSLAKTYLQNIRVAYPSNLDRDELRITQTGLLEAVISMTSSPDSIVSPDLIEKAKASQGIDIDIPVMKKGNVTIKNVRSCTISGGQSESDLITVVWKTIVADLLMVPSQYEKNQIKYLFDFNKKVGEIVEAFKVEMENDLDTAIDANKTLVYGSTIVGATGEYPLVANAIQVTKDQQDFFFNNLDSINFSDDFYNPTIKVVASPTIMPSISRFINQGDSNNTNTAFQFAGKDFTFSNRVSNGAGVIGTGYFMPNGSIGLITREDVDSRLGHKASDGTEWDVDTLPNFPFPVGIQYKSKCDDQSALETAGLGHLKATMVEHFQISLDYAIIVPYNSDSATKAGSIRKFEFVPNP